MSSKRYHSLFFSYGKEKTSLTLKRQKSIHSRPVTFTKKNCVANKFRQRQKLAETLT